MRYNFYANYCEDLKLAMMVGDTFEVWGVGKKVGKELPSEDKIMKFLENVEMDNNEMILIQEILSELDIVQEPSTFYNPASSVAK